MLDDMQARPMLAEPTLMERTLEVLDRMVADGVIGPYAIGGAVAAYKYIEAAMTEDLDILVSLQAPGGRFGLVSLEPIFRYLAEGGYTEFRREGLMVEGWPVQFLPIASPLDGEALETSVVLSQPSGMGAARVLLPEYLVAIALKVGRPKDFLRVSQFLDEEAVDLAALARVLGKHDLLFAWRKFCLATGRLPAILDLGGSR